MASILETMDIFLEIVTNPDGFAFTHSSVSAGTPRGDLVPALSPARAVRGFWVGRDVGTVSGDFWRWLGFTSVFQSPLRVLLEPPVAQDQVHQRRIPLRRSGSQPELGCWVWR